MSKLRRDPVTGRWVIIAPERVKRPVDYVCEQPPPLQFEDCPFCEGNETRTPFEITSYREKNSVPNGPGWRVRVVPNRFPVLRVEGEVDKRGQGLYDLMNGIGAHEIIIETPKHHRSMATLDVDAVKEVLWVYRDRLSDLKRDMRLVSATVFKTVGRKAGAVFEHSHSQVVATPVVPRYLQDELDGAESFHEYRGRCIYCDIIDQELSEERRIVSKNSGFIAAVPFAARFPFEVWILPRNHASSYESITRNEVNSLAEMLKSILARVEGATAYASYAMVLHSAPLGKNDLPYYHWHIEIAPLTSTPVGIEWSSGMYVNPVAPEEAAEFLRNFEV